MDNKYDYNKALKTMAMDLTMLAVILDEKSNCYNKELVKSLDNATLKNLYGACLCYIDTFKKAH